jgi:hypothetical protein
LRHFLVDMMLVILKSNFPVLIFFTKFIQMKFYQFGLLTLCLFSCVSLHTPSSHFTPALTQKNQFEGEVSSNVNSVNVNLAYSPLNHLSVLGGVQKLVRRNNNEFQKVGEIGLGYYVMKNDVLFGVNGFAGKGEYDLSFYHLTDSSGYNISFVGAYRKLALQAYIAFSDNIKKPNWLAGFSLKSSFYNDNLTAQRDFGKARFDLSQGPMSNSTIEPCIFTKNYFNKYFYFNTQVGMNISYDISMFWPTQYVFVRMGLGLKL